MKSEITRHSHGIVAGDRALIRSGLTLVEILIALTMTLIVLFAMAQAFQFASAEIASGRAVLEMSNRLRNAQQLLRSDLAGLTVEVRPHTETAPDGYFEYVDGTSTDKTAYQLDNRDGYLGDIDDMLSFTSRSLDGSFRGRYDGQSLQSSYAEIIWFTEINDINNDQIVDLDNNGVVDFSESVTLFRRVLLIRPDLNMDLGNNRVGVVFTGDESDGSPTDTGRNNAIAFFVSNDISARWIDSDGNGLRDLIVANTFSDLSRRENRFARDSRLFPHAIVRDGLSVTKMGSSNGFSGDDILLADIAAFDVQIYSPDAGVDLIDLDGNTSYETAVRPSDIGYSGLNDASVATSKNGGFVDLGSDPDNNEANNPEGNDFERGDPVKPAFTTLPTTRSQYPVPNTFGGTDVAYCTWSPHYESDGIDQDLALGDTFGPDQGTNRLDDDGVNGVDDDGEQETSPPYPYPVRGIKVTFRIIEKNTRQVRQSSVVQSFLPQ